MTNYPDDVRCHDHDSRSPFYDSSHDDSRDEAIEIFKSENADEIARYVREGIRYEIKCEELELCDGESVWIDFGLSIWSVE